MSTNTNQAPDIYEWTGPTGVKFREIKQPSGTYYQDTTQAAVINALERARTTHTRIRLFLGDTKTGRDWLEEWDVTGYVGRTMGPIKAPILLRNSRSTGGGIISTDCILRLIVDGREVYRHPKYRLPIIEIGCSPVNVNQPRRYYAKVNGELHARFKTEAQAKRWAAFMLGERMAK